MPACTVTTSGRGPSRTVILPIHAANCDTARTLALLGKALDECDCPHVTLTGGEPLLRPDLPRILEFLHAAQAQDDGDQQRTAA